MKLKTLKDIKIIKVPIKWTIPGLGKYHDGIGEYIEIDDLKQLAIKWVKEDIEEHYNLFRDVLKGMKIISPTMRIIRKWMERLNITEDDLK